MISTQLRPIMICLLGNCCLNSHGIFIRHTCWEDTSRRHNCRMFLTCSVNLLLSLHMRVVVLCFVLFVSVFITHDDFNTWKCFPHFWPFVREIYQSPLKKGNVFLAVSLGKRLRKHSSRRYLRHHDAHCNGCLYRSIDPECKLVYFTGNAWLSSYPGYFREPHWLSMGLLEISRVTLTGMGMSSTYRDRASHDGVHLFKDRHDFEKALRCLDGHVDDVTHAPREVNQDIRGI